MPIEGESRATDVLIGLFHLHCPIIGWGQGHLKDELKAEIKGSIECSSVIINHEFTPVRCEC